MASETVPAVWRNLIEGIAITVPRLAGIDAQRIWQSFRNLNREIRKLKSVPRLWLERFVPTWQDRNPDPIPLSDEVERSDKAAAEGKVTEKPRRPWAKKAVPCRAPAAQHEAVELVRLHAPRGWDNRADHAKQLIAVLGGPEPYRARVRLLMEAFHCPENSAELAVHGIAIRNGEIDP